MIIIINIYDEQFKLNEILYENGERILSLKKQCSMIQNDNCSWDIKIDFRKKLYDTFFNSKLGMDDDSLKMFEVAITKCGGLNKKLDIPFIRKAITYIENKSNVNYYEIEKWLNYYDLKSLSDDKYNNSKYSDKELFYLKKAKVLQNINSIDDLVDLIHKYEIQDQKNDEIIFFMNYHLCKLYYKNKNYNDANDLFEKLILIKREPYLLGLPIKYLDYTNEVNIFLLILELISLDYTEDYIYEYIYNWSKNYDEKELYYKIEKFYNIENGKIIYIDKKRINTVLYDSLCNNKKVKEKIYYNKVIKITKVGNAFVKYGNTSIFVKKNKSINLKVNDRISYICIKSYDKNYNIADSAVIIKNWR